jgi:phenylalanyl-tRNA synthetase alpha chain
MPVHLSPEQLCRDLDVRDLTDPHQGPHAIQILVDQAVDALKTAWKADVHWCQGPRIVPVEDNYDNLLIGPEAASRDARYTRYVDDLRMLRSHSSAMIPPALRAVAIEEDRDVVLVCPGIAYRRDAIDWQHTGTPHQLDLWRISASRSLTTDDLEEMITLLVDALLPGRPRRTEARVHPYTLEGRQVDVRHNDQGIEVWECGLAHPEVLLRAGIGDCSGLALGMGLDRLLMVRKGVPDIRLLRATDARITSQMTDLFPYVPVSVMPAVRRDLSIVVDGEDAAEDLGDRVRDALGSDADAVEEVAVLSQTTYEELSAAARHRLGIVPGQQNLLVTIVLRPLAYTLTDEEANLLRDRIYGALHQGSVHQWAAR